MESHLMESLLNSRKFSGNARFPIFCGVSLPCTLCHTGLILWNGMIDSIQRARLEGVDDYEAYFSCSCSGVSCTIS
jgi:hypothetical protein